MQSVAQMFNLALQHHQAGNLEQAQTLYRQILQIDPKHVDALHVLGVLAHQVGRSDLAVDYIQQALRLHPDFPAAYNNLGTALMAQGKPAQALASIRQALALKPDFAEAHNNLGNALKDQGKPDEAIASYRQAVALKPDFAEACKNLGNALKDQGNVLRAQGKLAEAIASYRQAVRLNANDAETHNNLGIALGDQGNLEEALASFQHALRLKPDFAEAHSNLGNAWRERGRLDEAVASYRQAVRLKPDYAEAFSNLGNALRDQGKLDEAIGGYRQALRLKPDYAEAYYNLGIALRDQGKLEEAISSYEQALRRKPGFAEAYSNLGVALTELGRIDEATASVREAIRLKPNHAEALWQLARLLGGKLPEADRVLIEGRLAEGGLSDADRVKLLFGLAEVCDARREYDQAAALLRQANALMLTVRSQRGQDYNREDAARFVENLMKAFTAAFFERVRGYGLETERPVFIVGLPRSGTTLTEQILAAHSQVFGAGELSLAREDFETLGTRPTDESLVTTLSGLPGEAIRRLAQRHLDQLGALNRTAARVVDKMPDNYLYVGLLAALFPKAKFIHCRRDLRDVAVSCWMTHSEGLSWTNDPADIAARFEQYQRLMEHWRAVLPVSPLEVQYEETVADLPGVARRLVEWCGLAWEPACLAFHEGKRPVRTASLIQVRQPIHAKSVGRWRNYERDLGPLLAALKRE